MQIKAVPLSATEFVPYGSVIDTKGEPSFLINGGRCGRFHDIAQPRVIDPDGRIAISSGLSQAVSLPMQVPMLERHPLGSQAFVPTQGAQMVIVVAEDKDGIPHAPRAFVSDHGQGVQYNANIWHGVLAPLQGPADFLIVDRVGPGNNLEEHFFDQAFEVIF